MGAPAPGAYSPPGFAYGPPPWEAERRKQIDRTKTGVLLLLIGTLILWIPLIGAIGGLLLLIGAILVILGRKAFGPAHARNVMISLGIFIVGIIASVVLGLVFILTLSTALAQLSGSATPEQIAAAVQSAFNTFLLGAIVVAAISGIASVLFTYALQNPTGRILLWAGYGANLAVSIAVFVVIGAALSAALALATSGGSFDETPILAVQVQITTLGLLSAIPAVLFAGANYIAWSRISRGEIPAGSGGPPGMPGAMPPMPPTGGVPPITPR